MNKKMLMYSIFMINIVIWVAFGYMKFSELSSGVIDGDKAIISIEKGANLSKEEFIRILCNTSEKLSSDIALQYLNDDYTYTYYRTTVDEKFINLYTEDNSTLPIEGKVYSSLPKGTETKIYGFIREEDAIKIASINDVIEENDISLSKGSYLLNKDKKDEYIKELEKYGIECENSVGVVADAEYALLYILMISFVTFFAISIVFYAFSQNRDIAIKKSMGYGLVRICCSKFISNFLYL